MVRSVSAAIAPQRSLSPPQFPLSATAPMVWLPYTAIDQLLQALRDSTSNHHSVEVGPTPSPRNTPRCPLGRAGGGNVEQDKEGSPHLLLCAPAQLYQKLCDKMEDYQQKVSVATRDRLYRCS